MSSKKFQIEQIKELIKLMETNELMEIELVDDDKKIRIKKAPPHPPQVMHHIPVVPAVSHNQQQQQQQQQQEYVQKETPSGLKEICSPMVGTFYRSPNPDSDPFIEVGDYINKGDLIGIIEAMKVMNEIKAESSGTIKEIVVENSQPVEFGETLFLVQPD